MKKVIAFLLSAIIIFSSSVLMPTASFATGKQHVEDALEKLQTKTGYIPGKTAAVTGNCFGFICAVAQNLYGVTYYYEQMNGSYQYNHTSNYKTVAKKTFAYPSSSASKLTTAKQIKDFIVDNAAAGDILSYGCANNSKTGHKHTAMIQHVDNEKILIYHSNYACGNYNSSSCHVDAVYWDSFLQKPTSNIYDNKGNITSENRFFGGPMDCQNGLGLSLNRYSKLTDKYYLDEASLASTTISTERKSSTSIKFSWKAVSDATGYCYSLKNSSGKYIYSSKKTTSTNVTVGGLITGEKYTFYVYPYSSSKQGDSASKAIQCLPPAPSKPVVNSSSKGISVSWNTRHDVSGYQVFRSTSPSGTFSLIGTVTDNDKDLYLDREISANKNYYFKVRRYLTIGNNVWYSGYSSVSNAVKSYLYAPKNIKITRTGTTSMRVNWSDVDNASKYYIQYKIEGGSWITCKTTSNYFNFSNLKVKKRYYYRVKSSNDFGSSSYSSTYSQIALPPTPSGVKARRVSSKSVTISWTKSQGFTGYYILRSTDSSFKKNLKKMTLKSNTALSYTDKSVSASTKYYYKVCRYQGSVSGSYSAVVKA